MSKYKVGDEVIDIHSPILAEDKVIMSVLPKKRWREQTYLIRLDNIYEYRKESQLIPKPLGIDKATRQ